MREMELNRCRDDDADEIRKSSVELEASNAACQACLEEAGKYMQDDKADDPRVRQLIKAPHAVHVLSHHLCAVKANKVEKGIHGARKVGKQVKWQVLDIKA